MKIRRPALLAVGFLLIVGTLAFVIPRDGPPTPQTEDEPTVRRLQLEHWPAGPSAARGQEVYGRWCIGCHGAEGKGDGEAAVFLNPQPRNFQKGKFKFRSTPPGQLPLLEDVVKTITCGLAGSSMPGFHLVPELERKDVAAWVLHLAAFGRASVEVDILMEEDELTLQEILDSHLEGLKKSIITEYFEARQQVPVMPRPEISAEALARIKTRFENECAKCHGLTGRGEGGSAYSLRDWKDSEIVPRDFTTGVFRSGSRPADLYLRLKTGLNGTPMPATPGTDEEIWAFVQYILNLKDPAAGSPKVRPGCASGEFGQ